MHDRPARPRHDQPLFEAERPAQPLDRRRGIVVQTAWDRCWKWSRGVPSVLLCALPPRAVRNLPAQSWDRSNHRTRSGFSRRNAPLLCYRDGDRLGGGASLGASRLLLPGGACEYPARRWSRRRCPAMSLSLPARARSLAVVAFLPLTVVALVLLRVGSRTPPSRLTGIGTTVAATHRFDAPQAAEWHFETKRRDPAGRPDPTERCATARLTAARLDRFSSRAGCVWLGGAAHGVRRRGLTARRKSLCIQSALHPASRRCSTLK